MVTSYEYTLKSQSYIKISKDNSGYTSILSTTDSEYLP